MIDSHNIGIIEILIILALCGIAVYIWGERKNMNNAPCPWQKEDGPRHSYGIVPEIDGVYVRCSTCGAQGPTALRQKYPNKDFDLEAEALRLWNDRGVVNVPEWKAK